MEYLDNMGSSLDIFREKSTGTNSGVSRGMRDQILAASGTAPPVGLSETEQAQINNIVSPPSSGIKLSETEQAQIDAVSSTGPVLTEGSEASAQFGIGTEEEGDLVAAIEAMRGSVMDEMGVHARSTILGQLLPEQSLSEERTSRESAMKSSERGTALGNFALGTAITLVGDLPAEVALAMTTGGVANLAKRGATALRASQSFAKTASSMRAAGATASSIRYMDRMADASGALSKTFMFGPSGRVADSAIKRFAYETVGATASEALASTAMGASPEETAQRVLGALALGGVFSEGMYRLAGGVKGLSKYLSDSGHSQDTVKSVADALRKNGDRVSEPKNNRVTPDNMKVRVDGEDANINSIKKASDEGKEVSITTKEMGDVVVLPSRTNHGPVKNAVISALGDLGIELHMVRAVSDSLADGVTVGNKVLIDHTVNNADFARLVGHEVFHTSINSLSKLAKTEMFSNMRAILERQGKDTSKMTDEIMIEELFADGAGRRGKEIIDELTRDLQKTESGRNAFKEFTEKVSDFITNLKEKFKYYVGDKKNKEMDDFAETLVKSVIGDKSIRHATDSTIKTSERLDSGVRYDKTDPSSTANSVVDDGGVGIKGIDFTDSQSVAAQRKSGIDETLETVNETRNAVKAVEPPNKDVKPGKVRSFANFLTFGKGSLTRQATGYFRSMGLPNLSKDIKQGNIETSIARNAISSDHSKAMQSVPDDMVQRMADSKVADNDINSRYGTALTEGQSAKLVAYARETNSGMRTETNKKGEEVVKGVDDDTGFGRKSAAQALVKSGIVDSAGNIRRFTPEEVRNIAGVREYDDALNVWYVDSGNGGKLGDHTALRMGGHRVTDESINNYVTIRYVDQPRQTVYDDSAFSFVDAGVWRGREGASSDIQLDFREPWNPLIKGKVLADKTAQMFGETRLRKSQIAMFGTDGKSKLTGYEPLEFVQSGLAPEYVTKLYYSTLSKVNEKTGKPYTSKEAAEIAIKGSRGVAIHEMDDGSLNVEVNLLNRGPELGRNLGDVDAGKGVNDRINEVIKSSRTDQTVGLIAAYIMRMKRISVLGWNTTFAIQVASAPYSAARIAQKNPDVAESLSGIEMVKSLWSMKDKKTRDAAAEEAMEMIPAFRDRIESGNVDIEFAELTADPGHMKEFKKLWRHARNAQGYKGNFDAYLKVLETSMTPIRDVDRITITSIAKKLMDVADTKFERGSKEWSDWVNESFQDALETQPSSIKGFKNAFQLSNDPLLRAITMFTGATGPMYDLYAEAAIKYMRGDTSMARQILVPMMMGVGYVGAVGSAATVAKGYLFQTESDRKRMARHFGGPFKDFIKRAIGSTAGIIPGIGPVVGGAVQTAVTGHSFDVSHPVLDYANDATKFVGQLSDFEVGRAMYTFGKNVLPYPIPRFYRRVEKEVFGN